MDSRIDWVIQYDEFLSYVMLIILKFRPHQIGHCIPNTLIFNLERASYQIIEFIIVFHFIFGIIKFIFILFLNIKALLNYFCI